MKLSISCFGGAIFGAAVYLLKTHGVKRKVDVTILAGGSNSARAAALKQGAVDAALLSSPDDIRAAGEGFRILLDVGNNYQLPWGGVSTTTGKIRGSPPEVEKVLRTVLQATKAITE